MENTPGRIKPKHRKPSDNRTELIRVLQSRISHLESRRAGLNRTPDLPESLNALVPLLSLMFGIAVGLFFSVAIHPLLFFVIVLFVLGVAWDHPGFTRTIKGLFQVIYLVLFAVMAYSGIYFGFHSDHSASMRTMTVIVWFAFVTVAVLVPFYTGRYMRWKVTAARISRV